MTDLTSESPHADEPLFARATQRGNAAIVCFDGFGSHVHCSAPYRSINIKGFPDTCRSLCANIGYRGKLDIWRASFAGEEVAA